MVDNRWHDSDENPKSYMLNDTYFSENLLLKCKGNTLKDYYYVVGYKNETANIWFNPLTEEKILDEVIAWKYIE